MSHAKTTPVNAAAESEKNLLTSQEKKLICDKKKLICDENFLISDKNFFISQNNFTASHIEKITTTQEEIIFDTLFLVRANNETDSAEENAKAIFIFPSYRLIKIFS